MTEFITSCECGCGDNEIEGAENVDLGVSTSVNDDVDRFEHIRAVIPKWLNRIEWRDEEDVQKWLRNDGYRPLDVLNQLRQEKEAGKPLEGEPWPDATRDPRNNDPYPVSLSNSAVRTYNSDEGKFDWDLSVGE